MYAVIRAGGKQYRVAPGDVIRIEKFESANDGAVEFTDVLAVSGEEGKIGGPQGETRVIGEVVDEGRGDKVLVFHYKRKKQYKKLQGHRQPFTAVRITEITADGRTERAPELPKRARKPKAEEGGAAPEEAVKPKRKKGGKGELSGPAVGAGGFTAKTRHAGGSKATGSATKGGKPPAPKKK